MTQKASTKHIKDLMFVDVFLVAKLGRKNIYIYVY